MTEATPRPWRVESGDIVVGPDDYSVCYACSIDVDDVAVDCANTALIVRAVNQYDAVQELIEAAREGSEALLRAHEALDANEPQEATFAYRAFEVLRDALSKLEKTNDA